MGFRDNLKLLFSKEKWRYSTLLVWLLLGIVFTQFLPIVGLIIFFPLLAFLLFLFLLSIISKKNIEEYPTWKIILMLFLSIPIMLIMIFILFVLFIISIVVYFFLTSWFTVYGCYLSGKHIDEQLGKSSYKNALRGLELFGGFIFALFLLIIFAAISIVYASLYPNIPILLNVVYFIVGAIIIGFLIINIIYLLFKKILIGWTGIFYVLIIVYTFYLVLKVFLGMGSSSSSSSLLTKIGLLIFDSVILLYAMSLIIGEQAQILAERILSNNRYIQMDTVIIGLIFAKVSYEFAVNFPYTLLKEISFLANIPIVELMMDVGSELSLIRNIMVLVFYIILLILVGIYQIRKHVLTEISIIKKKQLGDKVIKDEDLEEILEVENLEKSLKNAEIQEEPAEEEIKNQVIKAFESVRENLEETEGQEMRDETEKLNKEETRKKIERSNHT